MWIPPTLYLILCGVSVYYPPGFILCGILTLAVHFHIRGHRLIKESSGVLLCPTPAEQLAASMCVSVGVWFYMMGESLLGIPLAYFLLAAVTFRDYIFVWEPDENEDPDEEEDADPPSGNFPGFRRSRGVHQSDSEPLDFWMVYRPWCSSSSCHGDPSMGGRRSSTRRKIDGQLKLT